MNAPPFKVALDDWVSQEPISIWLDASEGSETKIGIVLRDKDKFYPAS